MVNLISSWQKYICVAIILRRRYQCIYIEGCFFSVLTNVTAMKSELILRPFICLSYIKDANTIQRRNYDDPRMKVQSYVFYSYLCQLYIYTFNTVTSLRLFSLSLLFLLHFQNPTVLLQCRTAAIRAEQIKVTVLHLQTCIQISQPTHTGA